MEFGWGVVVGVVGEVCWEEWFEGTGLKGGSSLQKNSQGILNQKVCKCSYKRLLIFFLLGEKCHTLKGQIEKENTVS